jgi:hypothetical protein
VTWENGVEHSGSLCFADTEGVTGSNPVAPTNHRCRSGRVFAPGLLHQEPDQGPAVFRYEVYVRIVVDDPAPPDRCRSGAHRCAAAWMRRGLNRTNHDESRERRALAFRETPAARLAG